jgi:hypothetical protein
LSALHLAADKDVGWLDVPVDDLLLVKVAQCLYIEGRRGRM